MVVHRVPGDEVAHALELRALEGRLVEHRRLLVADADADSRACLRGGGKGDKARGHGGKQERERTSGHPPANPREHAVVAVRRPDADRRLLVRRARRVGWRAKNRASASATAAGRSTCRRWRVSGRSTGSASGSHARSTSRRSGKVGVERSPSTSSTGWVIRRASSSVKAHCCRAGSSCSKNASASATACSKAPGKPASSAGPYPSPKTPRKKVSTAPAVSPAR